MTRPADLIEYIFGGRPHRLAAPLRRKMEATPRFAEFVEAYRDKIRKKLRSAGDAESALDVAGELDLAACLLADRRLELSYEPYASAKRRGPDFAVTYRANLVFNIEVTRMRTAADLAEGLDLARKEERVVKILLDKLGQMQPGMANLLVIQTGAEVARALDLARLMQAVKGKVESRDPLFAAASGYASPATFYKDFAHLSGILLWAAAPQLWVNRQARPALDEKVLRLVSSLAAEQKNGS